MAEYPLINAHNGTEFVSSAEQYVYVNDNLKYQRVKKIYTMSDSGWVMSKMTGESSDEYIWVESNESIGDSVVNAYFSYGEEVPAFIDVGTSGSLYNELTGYVGENPVNIHDERPSVPFYIIINNNKKPHLNPIELGDSDNYAEYQELQMVYEYTIAPENGSLSYSYTIMGKLVPQKV